MKTIRAYKGQRLDQIIYEEYKSLDKNIVNVVLAANPHLLKKVELEAGDIVNLPKIEQKETKGKYLW